MFISETEGNRFFKVFCALFRKHFQHLHIRPLEGDELIECMATYARLGCVGAAGSMDATEVTCENIATRLANVCNGDKGVGFLYQCIVTHNKICCDVAGSYYMTVNDKTSVKYNDFVQKLSTGAIYGNICYKVRTGPNEEDFIILTNPYLIVDGGYIEIPQLMSGFPISSDPIKYKYTDWIASVRKDVEQWNQYLKGRFRFFKGLITLQEQEDIDNAFYTAVILSNIICRHDGLDRLWKKVSTGIKSIQTIVTVRMTSKTTKMRFINQRLLIKPIFKQDT